MTKKNLIYSGSKKGGWGWGAPKTPTSGTFYCGIGESIGCSTSVHFINLIKPHDLKDKGVYMGEIIAYGTYLRHNPNIVGPN